MREPLNVFVLGGVEKPVALSAAFDELGQFWSRLRSRDVYDLSLIHI